MLTVADDGVGLRPGGVDVTAHFGLRGLESLVRDHGGAPHRPLRPGRRDDDTTGDAGMTIQACCSSTTTPSCAAGSSSCSPASPTSRWWARPPTAPRRWRRYAVRRPTSCSWTCRCPATDGVTATRRHRGRGRTGRPGAHVVLRRRPDRRRARRGGGRLPAQGRRPRGRHRGRACRQPRASPRCTRGRPAAAARAAGVRRGGRPHAAGDRGARCWSGRGWPTSRSPAGSGISERTVKAHLTSVFASIGVADRTQAASGRSAAGWGTEESVLITGSWEKPARSPRARRRRTRLVPGTGIR